ncbi:MAG: glycosyltransferase [Nitrospinae bacterium]|nr:glycosyltransferase [Nitrospinota bacterium]
MEAAAVNPNHQDARLLTRVANLMTNLAPEHNLEAAPALPVVSGKGIDVGCGSAKTHPDAIGVDLTPQGASGTAGGQKGAVSVADVVGSGDNLTMFADGELDYVIARHNLEHYVDPLKALDEWARVLKPGGVICLVLPDDEAFDTIHADESHLHVFTKGSLKNLVSLVPPLSVVEIGTCITRWSFYAILQKTGPGRRADYPYRRRVKEHLARSVEIRAHTALAAGMPDIAAAAIKTLARLRPGAPLPADPQELHPAPYQEPLTSGGGLRVAVLESGGGTAGWGDALRGMGHLVREFPPPEEGKAGLALEMELKDFEPDFVASARYWPSVTQTLALLSIPQVLWTGSSPVDIEPWRRDFHHDTTFVFHVSAMGAAALAARGVPRVRHLPLAARGDGARRADDPHDVRLTGASGGGYNALRARLRAGLMNGETPGEAKNEIFRWIRVFGSVITLQAQNLTQWVVPGAWDQLTGGAGAPECAGMTLPELMTALGEAASARQRRIIAQKLGEAGLTVNGPGAASVHLHLTPPWMLDACPAEAYEALSRGEFLMLPARAGYGPGLAPGEDFAAFSSPEEAAELAARYLGDASARQRIAANGQRAVMKRHTMRSRWDAVLQTLRGAGALKEGR